MPAPAGADWLVLDPPGRVVLLFLSVLFLLCSLYASDTCAIASELLQPGLLRVPDAVLGHDDAGDLSHHLGLMWVAIEATTLGTAPSSTSTTTQRSLEATWKYLLIGSVGIALALLGSFFLAYASLGKGGRTFAPVRPARSSARRCSPSPGCTRRSCCSSSATAPRWAWRRCTPGSRTPTARRRAWSAPCSPAASRAAPSWRSCASIRSARRPARADFARPSALLMGLLSMAVAGGLHGAAARLQADAGLLQRRAHGHPGPGHRHRRAGALFGALLHLINNGLTKGVLFLSAGNIHRAYDDKITDDVRGALRRLPLSGPCSWRVSWPSPARRRSGRS